MTAILYPLKKKKTKRKNLLQNDVYENHKIKMHTLLRQYIDVKFYSS